MREYHLHFQVNTRPRDYVYELSALYLTARCIHLAMELRLANNITDAGTSVNDITNNYPQYDADALILLIDILVAYSIFTRKEDNKLYPTAFSLAFEINPPTCMVSDEQWNSSFDILTYLSESQSIVDIKVDAHCLTYTSHSASAIISELSQLHLLSRAIRFATICDIFEYYSQQILPATIDARHKAFRPTFKLLSRYKLLNYDDSIQRLNFTPYTSYLLKSHPESIYYAMFMVDEKWWKAVSLLNHGLKKTSVSAYEIANGNKFYEGTTMQSYYFAKGMASISLLEDQEVVAASEVYLRNFTTIIDIGGGEGGLLSLYHKIFDGNKHYILYDQTAPTSSQGTQDFSTKFEVIVGNFMQL